MATETKNWHARDPADFKDIDSIRRSTRRVESKTNAFLAKMTPAGLERELDFSKPGMPPRMVRVEDVLVHLVLENTHHFGEFIALLWQMDVAPSHMGWISYLQR